MNWLRLRHAAVIDPSKSQVADLPAKTPVAFLPMRDVGTGGRLRPHEVRELGEVYGGYTYMRGGDVAIATISPSFQNGKVGFLDHPEQTICFATTELTVIRPRPGVDPRFLLYVLQSAPFVSGGTARFYGVAGQQRVPTDYLRDFRLWLPGVKIQGKIADQLDDQTRQIDRMVAQHTRMLNLLQERATANAERILLADDAPHTALGRVLRQIEQGSSPVASVRPRADGSEWAVLKLSAVSAGKFRPDENKALDAAPPPGIRHEVRHGDVLISRANTPSLVGEACFVANPPPRLLLPDLIYRLSYDPQRIYGPWLARVLRSSFVREQITGAARGSSQSMVKLRGEDIKGLRVPLPSVEEQQRQDEQLARHDASAQALSGLLERQSALLAERRQALITAVVTGQLDLGEAA